MFCMRTRSALAAHPLKNAFQRVQAVTVDDQFAAPAAALLHGDAGVEDLAQFAFQIGPVGAGFFAPRRFAARLALEIGSASRRERECEYVYTSVVADSQKKK